MDRVSYEEYAMRVSKGAELLDQKESLWYLDIDTMILNTQHPDVCIAGQLFPNTDYVAAMRRLGLNCWDKGDIEHGFDLSSRYIAEFGYGDHEILTILWTKEIMERRDN